MQSLNLSQKAQGQFDKKIRPLREEFVRLDSRRGRKYRFGERWLRRTSSTPTQKSEMDQESRNTSTNQLDEQFVRDPTIA